MVISNRVGHYVTISTLGEECRAYVPKPLPPDPVLDMRDLYPLLERANIALGRLDGISRVLPDISVFLYSYVRKEAVLSSYIEGTQSSLSDLLQYESASAPGVPIDDVEEVSRYVDALNYGLLRLGDLPLSLRLLREIHGRLMVDARGLAKGSGEFRTSQNWIGGSRPGNAVFVPPPPREMLESLYSFEDFLHSSSDMYSPLVRAALVHVQFETIHPFLDGNGRLGRLLIIFILCIEGVMERPLLYLSLYFKLHRGIYYERLQGVRESGDWESWVRFFLEGVIYTGERAFEGAQAILELFESDRVMVSGSRFSSGGALKLHDSLKRRPIASTKSLSALSGLSIPAVLRNLELLMGLGLVEETSGKQRNKVFVYRGYMDILNRDMDMD